ncbi:hypothetical protein ACS04_22600 [Streptomyces roseus]|uniref:DUF5753 domain-containing protein n=1 Tax=Streptomyces roseus TaxID=66430 RepID=A0A0J6XLQ2_9ACTN|nr:hypothetical protein ACS04_22600 [Streptomyces roseus]
MADRPIRPPARTSFREELDRGESDTTLARRLWGFELREARDSLGWTNAEAVRRGAASSATVLSRLEQGKIKAKVTEEVAQTLAVLYGADERTAVSWRNQAAQISQERTGRDGEASPADGDFKESPAFADILRLERRASEIISFAGLYVPGRVQTRQYSKVVMERACDGRKELLDLVPGRLRQRHERQELLEWGTALHYSMIIDEHVLTTPIPGDGPMLEQLLELQKLAKTREWIHLRVLPRCQWEHELPKAMTMSLFRFPVEQGAELEQATTPPAILYLEGSSPELSRLYTDQAKVDAHDANLTMLSNLSLDVEDSLGFVEEHISRFEAKLRGGSRSRRPCPPPGPSRYPGHATVLDPASGAAGRGLGGMTRVPAGHIAGSVLADHAQAGEEAGDVAAGSDVAPVPAQRLP